MKFKISKFDRFVGIFSVIGISGLLVLIFLTGTTQKWFVKKLNYYTIFPTASGLTQGMDLTYKGFSIGKIRKITLEGHMVRADYYILADYEDYIKEGSLVQLITSPIGLGSSFVFHPGRGEENLPGNSEIYRHDSRKGQEILENKMNRIIDQSDSIGVLLNKVSNLLDNVNKTLGNLNDAIVGRGNSELKGVLQNLRSLLSNLESITKEDSEGEGIINNIVGEDVFNELNQILLNLNNVTSGAESLVNGISPEIQGVLVLLQTTLTQVQDVLTGLKNNPLIKNGIPDRSQSNPATSASRNMDF